MPHSRVSLWIPVAALVLWWGVDASLPADDTSGAALTGARCLPCHGTAPDAEVVGEDGSAASLHVDPLAYRASAHGALECEACHWRMSASGEPQGAEGEAIDAAWLRRLVTCVPDRARRVLESCAPCHRQEANDYARSIHFESVSGGDAEAPVCSDCHGAHAVMPHDDIESSTSLARVPATCGRCHSDARLMARYDVRTDTVKTFEESFHGKKHELGSSRAAVCSSCHGGHDIRPSTDPSSRLSPAHRVAACSECHPGCTEQFALSFGHKPATAQEQPLVYWIGVFYQAMIALTIGGMAGYIGLDLLRKVLNLRGGGGSPPPGE